MSLERRTPLRRTGPPKRRTPLRASSGVARGGQLPRRAAVARGSRSGRARPDEPLAAWCEVAIPGVCLGRATDRHHRKLRKHGGGDERENTLDVCGSGTTGCHGHIHAHPAESYERGWLIRGVA